jgi:UPF0271 protein
MKTIDLNCDMGESFGAWKMGNDAEIMNYVSSVNVACGFHAGDASTIRETVQLAAQKGVAVGAHPSFPDLQGFGRRTMSLSAQEIFDLTLYQVSAVDGICRAYGVTLNHVKPHGALYNLAATDAKVAAAICAAVKQFNPNLVFYGLSGSCLISEGRRAGLKTAGEVFADRTYQPDGTLTPRSKPDALIETTDASLKQVLQMIFEKTVTATNGQRVSLTAETVCIHGDGTHAVAFGRAIHKRLRQEGILIEPVTA